ncbi:MAG: Crp/Fnr family transcriptional regulator [Chitinophagaceae bacterium]|nr:Crp/Fnr family transcriptional regulator [Chitinophagaceae bacterium]
MRHKFERSIKVTDDEWLQIISGRKEITIPKRTVFSRPGTVFSKMYYLEKGMCRSYIIDENGEEKTIFFFKEDDWVTEYLSFAKEQFSNFYFETIEDCHFSYFFKEGITQLYADNPKFLKFHIDTTDDEYAKLVERMVQFYIDDLAVRHQKLTQKFPELFQRVPQHMIASYLGVKPQSLSRMIAGMKGGGLKS